VLRLLLKQLPCALNKLLPGLVLRRKAKTTPVRSLNLRESLRHSPTSWPRVTNIANATSFARHLLLTFQLCTPHAGLARRFGWIGGGASEDHQKDYGREESKAKAHIVPYEPVACLGISFLPLPPCPARIGASRGRKLQFVAPGLKICGPLFYQRTGEESRLREGVKNPDSQKYSRISEPRNPHGPCEFCRQV
jgi:hypothetical protein